MRKNIIARSACGLLFATAISAPAWGQTPAAHQARPGSINYVEGQASIGTAVLTAASVGTVELERDQVLTTQTGKVEILLTPGVFLRLADNSSLRMISPDLANTEVKLETDIKIDQDGGTAKLLKRGLYDFEVDCNEVRVFSGAAQVTVGNRKVTLDGSQKLELASDKLKPLHFQSRQYQDEFYRWNGLRSGYLSEASVDVARTFIGVGPGWYAPGWVGLGWYWNPWFSTYTFLPVDGVYYGPFGWGFYSPIAVYWSPFVFYGHYPHAFGEFHYPYGHGFPPPAGRGGRIGR